MTAGETVRVLLVEDDPGDAFLVQELLTEAGQHRPRPKIQGQSSTPLHLHPTVILSVRSAPLGMDAHRC